MFLSLKEALDSTHLLNKTLLGGISLTSAKFLLFFREKEILKRLRVFEKEQLQKLYKEHHKSFIKKV